MALDHLDKKCMTNYSGDSRRSNALGSGDNRRSNALGSQNAYAKKNPDLIMWNALYYLSTQLASGKVTASCGNSSHFGAQGIRTIIAPHCYGNASTTHVHTIPSSRYVGSEIPQH